MSSSLEVAEACKILENTYRAVNIALVNELKMLYDKLGIDVWEVIDAAKTQAVRLPGVLSRPRAGRTLHSDRSVLPDRGWHASHGEQTRFIELAGEINTAHAALRREPACRVPQRRSASRSTAAASPSWAWPTRRTWTTRAKARRSS